MKHYSFIFESFTKDPKLLKLNSINNIKERIEYCDNNFTFLDRGVAKRVYLYDKNSVLKIAYNKKGLEQNNIEILLSKYNFDFLAKTIDYDDKNRWILSEYCYCTFGDRGRKDKNKDQFNQKIKNITGGLMPAELWLLCKIFVHTKINNFTDIYRKAISDSCEGKLVLKKWKLKGFFHSDSFKETIDELISKYKFQNYTKNLTLQQKSDFLTPILYCYSKLKTGRKIDYKIVFNYIDSGKYKNIKFLTDILRNEAASKVIDFGDCLNSRNTGICKRNGKDTLIIIDYGWKHK